jgi:tetratricopeptide (TPR) repeat protein
VAERQHAAAICAAALATGVWFVTAEPALGLGRSPAAVAFAECESKAAQTWTYDALLCVYRAGVRHNVRSESRARLVRLGAGRVDHPWATLVLALATAEQLHDAEATALFEKAADGFVRVRDADGEIIARQNLRTLYHQRGDAAAAVRQVQLAVAAAEASGKSLLIARASVIEALQVTAVGGDVGNAYRVLRRAERLAFPAGPIALRRSILLGLANAAMYLGRFDEAIDALEQHRALRAEDGSLQDAASIIFNLLNVRSRVSEARPNAGARPRLVLEGQRALAETRALRQPRLEARVHQALGELLRPSDPVGAVEHLRQCLEIASRLGYPELRADCLWSLSLHEAARDPRRAEQLSQQALSLVRGNPGGPLLAFAWQARLRLVWRILPEDQAIPESMNALDAIERLRARQMDGASRAGLFSAWVRDYHWLTGQLLQAATPRLPQAFEIGERMRARVLLESLVPAGVQSAKGVDADAGRRQIAQQIARTQRQLLSTSLPDAERRTLLDELRLLEIERADLGEGRVPVLEPAAASFASLDAVQRTLEEDEAMVWFSMAPWKDLYDEFGGGSWAVAITRRAATVHPLSASVDLDAQVAALTGLLRDRDADANAWAPATHRLGKVLLGDALSRLPSTVTRLVIVSDGALHRAPFEVLSPDAGAMLGERFDISVTPSATLWLRQRESAGTRPGGGVLVLADPDVERGSPDGDARLDALPGARREARAIASILDLDPRDVAEGPAASERFVKSTPLGPFSVLHVAAHARADSAFPERSAVFLAPGAEGEDGWLQPGEIAALDLRGRLVVLSACDSAEGSLLSGEGPLSLARAFFAAGARGVVATRWPLRDDDAAFMMEHFYRSLAEGHSVGTALRQARRDAVDAGLPAAAWAGIAALGDGGQSPITALPQRGRPWPWVVAVVVPTGIGGAAWLRRRRLRRRHGTDHRSCR